MKQKFELDRKDWQILEVLQANARCTNTEIGKRIGLSQPAVTARIQRLENAGVIQGYAARIDPKRVGAEIAAVRSACNPSTRRSRNASRRSIACPRSSRSTG